MRRLFIMAFVLISFNIFAQTENEVKVFRKAFVEYMDDFGREYEPLVYFDTWFSDNDDALVVQVRMTADAGDEFTAKKMCNNMIDEWTYTDKDNITKYGDINYLKVIFIDYTGKKSSYKRRIKTYY